MADQYKIKETWMGIWVHSGPGISNPRQSVIYGNDNVTYSVTARENKHWVRNVSEVSRCRQKN